MAGQDAKQDRNQFPGILAHTGTAGTAELEKVTSTDGALNVDIVSGEIVASLGTVNVLKAGSIVVTKGTIDDLDTVGTVGVLNDGSVDVTALPDLPGGTIDKVSSVANIAGGSVIVTTGTIGDINNIGTIGVINDGTVTVGNINNVGTVGVVNDGSIVVTAGTISDMNTIGTIGVINDGTVTVGDINNVGTVGVVNDGSIVVTTGTIGDINNIGTVGVVNDGSIVVTTGTIGDINNIGTVGVVNDGSVDVTVLPDLPGGTVDVVSSVSNVAGGSIIVTTGTIGDINNIGTVGVVNDGSVDVTALPDSPGGTVDLVTSVSNLAGGSIVVTAGTIGDLDTVGTVGVLNDGSIDVTALPDLPGGTVDVVASVSNVAGGTVGITNLDLASTNNSSTSALGTAEVFTGTGDDCLGYSAVTVQVYADQDSAADGMTFQFSIDNTNWDDVYTWTLDTSEMATRRFQFPITGRYFRVVYTNNDSAAQSAFRLQTILHRQNQLTSIHRIADDVHNDRSAQIMKSALIARVSGTGDFKPIQANAAGILKIGGAVEVDTITADLPGGTVDLVTSVSNLAGGSVVVTAGTIGDLDTVGTVGVLNDGSVAVTALPDSPGGTVDLVTSVSNLAGGSVVVTAGTIGDLDTVGTIGVVNDGSVDVTALPDLPGGTVDVVSSITNVAGGSIIVTTGTIGDINNIGTVGVVNDGSVDVTALPDLPGGTVDVVSSITNVAGGSIIVTTGTIGDINNIGTVGVINDGSVAVTALVDSPGGTVDLITSVTNLAAGSVKVTAGTMADVTVTTLPDSPGGTVDLVTSVSNLANGTVAVKNTPPTTVLIASALGAGAAATFGTLSAASGAGTSHVVAGCSIVVHSGTVDCYLGYGTAITGGSVLARGSFPEGGGIARNFTHAIKSGANSEICYKLGGAGTVYFAVDYWKE